MFKARMRFEKTGRAKFISHLDLMQAMQRAMARCEMPLWFTEGFNQHAYVSVALPLSTGFSGECEFIDFNLLKEVPDDMTDRLNAVFPEGLKAVEIYPLEEGGMKVRDIAFSRYRITYRLPEGQEEAFAAAAGELFAQDEILILKKSKRAEKTINMREWMKDLAIMPGKGSVIIEVTTAAGNQNMSPEYLTKAIAQYLPAYEGLPASYHRLAVFTEDGTPFR